MPLQIDRAVRFARAVNFCPAMGPARTHVLSRNEPKFLKPRIAHDLFPEGPASARNDLNHRLHRPFTVPPNETKLQTTIAVATSLEDVCARLTEARLQERTEHDMNIDISHLGMSKRFWQSADDLEAKPLPQSDCRFVCGHNKVELHRAKAEPERFFQAMFAHCAANPLSLRVRCNHECRVRHVRTRSQLIRSQNVSANNPPVALRDISMRVGPNPIRQRILARHLRIERIGVGGSNYVVKNSPDCLAIRFYRLANLDHRGNKRLSRLRMDVAPESQPFSVLLPKHRLVWSSFAAALSAPLNQATNLLNAGIHFSRVNCEANKTQS